jgi:predicted RNA-binding protein with PUA-like domain
MEPDTHVGSLLVTVSDAGSTPAASTNFSTKSAAETIQGFFVCCRPPLGHSAYNSVMNYLLKTEPSVYSFADLQREKTTIWDGVTNPAAVKNLRGMKAGDRLVIYHTGDEKSAVGTASVISVDASEPKNPKVRISAGKAIAKPVQLAEIKKSALFSGSPLVTQGRLSVVPLTNAQLAFLTR